MVNSPPGSAIPASVMQFLLVALLVDLLIAHTSIDDIDRNVHQAFCLCHIVKLFRVIGRVFKTQPYMDPIRALPNVSAAQLPPGEEATTFAHLGAPRRLRNLGCPTQRAVSCSRLLGGHR